MPPSEFVIWRSGACRSCSSCSMRFSSPSSFSIEHCTGEYRLHRAAAFPLWHGKLLKCLAAVPPALCWRGGLAAEGGDLGGDSAAEGREVAAEGGGDAGISRANRSIRGG